MFCRSSRGSERKIVGLRALWCFLSMLVPREDCAMGEVVFLVS